MDKHRIDSHKLMLHVPRVCDWLAGRLVYPIYAEIATSGTCNHRCTYCALDYMEYQPRFIDTDILKQRLTEMAGLGLKSVMYAGEGEPLLHKDFAEIVRHTKRVGIDVAITTNGVFLKPALAREILSVVTWIKVSVNGATPETYAKVHRCDPGDLQKVFSNVEEAVKLKKADGLSCTIGAQLVLLPDNCHEAVLMAEKVKAVGADYLVIKPYSQHPMSKTRMYENFVYEGHVHLSDALQRFNDDSFRVIFRTHAMRKWDSGDRTYERCHALPFWTYIDAGGGVWGCSAYLGDERFLYGHITEHTFKEIWEGEKRRRCLEWVENELDTSLCRVNCRMDEINRYLWELKHPSEHVNFI